MIEEACGASLALGHLVVASLEVLLEVTSQRFDSLPNVLAADSCLLQWLPRGIHCVLHMPIALICLSVSPCSVQVCVHVCACVCSWISQSDLVASWTVSALPLSLRLSIRNCSLSPSPPVGEVTMSVWVCTSLWVSIGPAASLCLSLPLFVCVCVCYLDT